MPTNAFTSKAPFKINALDTFVYIKSSLEETFPNKKYIARWDTGATNSVIGRHIINELDLKIVSKTIAHGVSGPGETECYYIDVVLPNSVLAQNILVLSGNFCDAGFDMLIGMDIITAGDFAITNFNNQTTFSFRMPSVAEIDFVKEDNKPYAVDAPVQHRNSKCSCGSGKKYKNCCGK